jgi:DNA-binding transcriptional LysR family regulator
LASRTRIAAAEIARHPLIGIEPRDPHGQIVVRLFERASVPYRVPIKARFGVTVCALVRQNLGISVIDEFTLAELNDTGLRTIPIKEATTFQTYVAYRKDTALSGPSSSSSQRSEGKMERTHRAMPAT